MGNDIEKTNLVFISDAQRRCVGHVLRNNEQALSGVLALLTDSEVKITPSDLIPTLRSVCQSLNRMLAAAERNSFCSLTPEDCEFTSKFTKCQPSKDRS